ncbi:MAG: PA2778 family cysteine peptidase [Wenzhouxiangellaceae bacterium]|nr:PA2778 family cysteine peptidase [Wenzhouxiangellaceae bacterium]
MRTRLGDRAAAMAALIWLAGGCATFDTQIPESLEPSVKLAGTPFYPQLQNHCGPAALSTLLEASGVRPDYDEVAERVYIPGLEGSLQVEMMAAARRYDRIPYRVPGELSALLTEVEAGHPVLILQNLRVRSLPVWHYAVVIGYDRDQNQILMRSGTERELSTPTGRWMRRWDWASRWAIVVLEPGDLPVSAELPAVLRALSDFDEHGSAQARLKAWRAASEKWPREPLAWMGLGNAHYALGEREAAASHLRQTLEIRPGHWPARLNLAQLLLELDQPCRGKKVIQARSMPFDYPLMQAHGKLSIRLDQACEAKNRSG